MGHNGKRTLALYFFARSGMSNCQPFLWLHLRSPPRHVPLTMLRLAALPAEDVARVSIAFRLFKWLVVPKPLCVSIHPVAVSIAFRLFKWLVASDIARRAHIAAAKSQLPFGCSSGW